MIIWVSSSVLGPVGTPEGSGVIEILSGGWDDGVTEANLWWNTSDELNVVWVVVMVVSSFDSSEQCSNSEQSHNIVEKIMNFKIIKNKVLKP